MIVTIHQPEHMPWTGFFNKMSKADLYVHLDDVQYKKNNFQNRNKVVASSGSPFWISIPLQDNGHTQKINEKRMRECSWRNTYLEKIKDSYANAKYFDDYFEEIEKIIQEKYDNLADFNIALIDWFRNKLQIHTKTIKSSSIAHQGSKSDLIENICLSLGADTYLSGASGRDYLNLESFKFKGMEVLFHSFIPPVYKSLNYHPGLSSLDVLMNCGPLSREIILFPQNCPA
ncbi:WbqC-like protein family [Candidatus Methylopumilus universalis]|uniref:WbqC family protein n=1 Tax=Candidatus Methylopumilus universalis TaxID=2588536 RepID=UPI003BEF0BFB